MGYLGERKRDGRDRREIYSSEDPTGGQLPHPPGPAPECAEAPTLPLPGGGSRPEVGNGEVDPGDGGRGRERLRQDEVRGFPGGLGPIPVQGRDLAAHRKPVSPQHCGDPRV